MIRYFLLLHALFALSCGSGQSNKKPSNPNILGKAWALLYQYDHRNKMLQGYCVNLRGSGIEMKEADSLQNVLRKVHPVNPSQINDNEEIKKAMAVRLEEQSAVDKWATLFMQKIDASPDLKNSPYNTDFMTQWKVIDLATANSKKVYLQTIQ